MTSGRGANVGTGPSAGGFRRRDGRTSRAATLLAALAVSVDATALGFSLARSEMDVVLGPDRLRVSAEDGLGSTHTLVLVDSNGVTLEMNNAAADLLKRTLGVQLGGLGWGLTLCIYASRGLRKSREALEQEFEMVRVAATTPLNGGEVGVASGLLPVQEEDYSLDGMLRSARVIKQRMDDRVTSLSRDQLPFCVAVVLAGIALGSSPAVHFAPSSNESFNGERSTSETMIAVSFGDGSMNGRMNSVLAGLALALAAMGGVVSTRMTMQRLDTLDETLAAWRTGVQAGGSMSRSVDLADPTCWVPPEALDSAPEPVTLEFGGLRKPAD